MKLLVLTIVILASNVMANTKCANGLEVYNDLQDFLNEPRVLELIVEIEKQSHNKRVLQATDKFRTPEMYAAQKAFNEAWSEFRALANNKGPEGFSFILMKIRSSSAVLGTYTAHLQQQLESVSVTLTLQDQTQASFSFYSEILENMPAENGAAPYVITYARIAQRPLARVYVVDELGRAIVLTTAQNVAQFVGSERLTSSPSLNIYSVPLTYDDVEQIYESQITSDNLVRCN